MTPVPSVLFGIDDRVCRIRLNRPEKLNALNEEVRTGLHRGLSELQDRPDVSVVVITGGGSWAARRHRMGGWQRLLDLLESVPQVTVAGIHGHCIGGAALLAVACDIRVAAEDA